MNHGLYSRVKQISLSNNTIVNNGSSEINFFSTGGVDSGFVNIFNTIVFDDSSNNFIESSRPPFDPETYPPHVISMDYNSISVGIESLNLYDNDILYWGSNNINQYGNSNNNFYVDTGGANF